MTVAYAICDRCERTLPVEGDRDVEGFELCDACVRALTERRISVVEAVEVDGEAERTSIRFHRRRGRRCA